MVLSGKLLHWESDSAGDVEALLPAAKKGHRSGRSTLLRSLPIGIKRPIEEAYGDGDGHGGVLYLC